MQDLNDSPPIAVSAKHVVNLSTHGTCTSHINLLYTVLYCSCEASIKADDWEVKARLFCVQSITPSAISCSPLMISWLSNSEELQWYCIYICMLFESVVTNTVTISSLTQPSWLAKPQCHCRLGDVTYTCCPLVQHTMHVLCRAWDWQMKAHSC